MIINRDGVEHWKIYFPLFSVIFPPKQADGFWINQNAQWKIVQCFEKLIYLRVNGIHSRVNFRSSIFNAICCPFSRKEKHKCESNLFVMVLIFWPTKEKREGKIMMSNRLRLASVCWTNNRNRNTPQTEWIACCFDFMDKLKLDPWKRRFKMSSGLMKRLWDWFWLKEMEV